VVAAILLAALGACGDGGLARPAAVVNGSTISQDDLQREVDVFLAVTPDQRSAFEGPNPSARKEDLNRGALAFLIQQQVVETYAAQKRIAPDAQQLAQSVDQAVQGAGGQAALGRQLAVRHLTQADVRAFVTQVALRQAIGASLTTDANQQAQAFSTWLLGAMRTARVEVNPRFGAFDVSTAGVQPITSTDQLP
jgi:hypothetical protein